jgi:hypothetical protein
MQNDDMLCEKIYSWLNTQNIYADIQSIRTIDLNDTQMDPNYWSLQMVANVCAIIMFDDNPIAKMTAVEKLKKWNQYWQQKENDLINNKIILVMRIIICTIFYHFSLYLVSR